MVTHTIQHKRGARHIDDGDIVLERGRSVLATILLSGIPGGSWTRQKLERLANACQAQMDSRRLISSLEDIDEDKIHALAGDDAWFASTYHGLMFIDGDSLVDRSDTISFTLEDGDLLPTISVVR